MAEPNMRLKRVLRACTCVLLAVAIAVSSASDADAARKRVVKKTKRAPVASAGVNDPRYADIILNPVTGEVYHSDDPDGRRYPASLTKMMTLYLLFEALAQEKTSLGAHLDVSDYAASMPQTNLHLQGGDTIPVEIAIKALVVRSANDVAVVVGEALGGDVDRFAQMMTNKARQLGMSNTIFKNPNGLPNNGQVTTARDMAKLGIALKRDFPQYYDYFETRQFSWQGVTYYTHNRVMLRYAGVDGIKTGFIGLSGFNVVTSVTRGGRPLVGVVMGGGSGAWRDNRMIQLLDESYKIIAERGAVRGKMYSQNLPLKKDPKTGKTIGKGINAQMPADVIPEEPVLSEEQVKAPSNAFDAEDAAETETVVTVDEPAAPKPAAAPVVAAPVVAAVAAKQIEKTPAVTPPPSKTEKTNYIRIVDVPQKKPEPATLPAKAPAVTPAPATIPATAPAIVKPTTPTVTPPRATLPVTPQAPMPPAVSAPGAVYGIQVGAFSSNELATRAVNDAYALAKPSLTGARMAVAGPEIGGAPVHRARMVGLTEAQAKQACQKLIAHATPCFSFKTAQ